MDDVKPPRFMVVLVDFQTDTQIQVGAPVMSDFLKPLPEKDQKKNERFELERVIRYFEKQVKKAEKTPFKKPVQEGEVVDGKA
jgi:hypothetical protein